MDRSNITIGPVPGGLSPSMAGFLLGVKTALELLLATGALRGDKLNRAVSGTDLVALGLATTDDIEALP